MRNHGALRPAIAWIALTLLVAGCSSGSAGPSRSNDLGSADVTIVTRDMEFDRDTLTTSGGSTWTLQLVNEDAAPHNVAIYTDASAAESLFVGELVTEATIVYEVPALEPGTYFFRCDLHPDMKGTLVVEG